MRRSWRGGRRRRAVVLLCQRGRWHVRPFNAAVIEVVATFDLQLDGDLAGEYRIAA